MVWRIYRLPGSRENWHIDAGPGTQVINVRKFEGHGYSVDVGGQTIPRAWIEYAGKDLHIINGTAVFLDSKPVESLTEQEIEDYLKGAK